MKNKIAWILFSVMTVAVIILSSVLITNSVKADNPEAFTEFVKGYEILEVDVQNVQSATATLSSADPGNIPITIQLDEKQINYIVSEFNSSMFERYEEFSEGGTVTVELTLKDGRQKKFNLCGGVEIEGKRYKCHSYLGRYCFELFYT